MDAHIGHQCQLDAQSQSQPLSAKEAGGTEPREGELRVSEGGAGATTDSSPLIEPGAFPT